jgi:hypothetical protein
MERHTGGMDRLLACTEVTSTARGLPHAGHREVIVVPTDQR